MRRRATASNAVSFFAFQDIVTSVVGIFVLIMLIMVVELTQTVAKTASSQLTMAASESIESLAELERQAKELAARYESMQEKAAATATNNRFSRVEKRNAIEIDIDEINEQIRVTTEQEAAIRNEISKAEEIRKSLEKELVNKKAAEGDATNDQRRKTIAAYSTILQTDGPLIFRKRTNEGRSLCLIELTGSSIKVSDAESGLELNFSGLTRIEQLGAWLSNITLPNRHFLVILKPSGKRDFESVRDLLEQRRTTFGFDVADEQSRFQLISDFEEMK